MSIIWNLSLSKDREVQDSILSWLTFSGLVETEFSNLFIYNQVYHSVDKCRLSMDKPVHSKWVTLLGEACNSVSEASPGYLKKLLRLEIRDWRYTSSLIEYLDLNDLSLGYQIVYRMRYAVPGSLEHPWAFVSKGDLGAFSLSDSPCRVRCGAWEDTYIFANLFANGYSPSYLVGTRLINEGTRDPTEEVPPKLLGSSPLDSDFWGFVRFR